MGAMTVPDSAAAVSALSQRFLSPLPPPCSLQALDRGATLVGADKVATGHNADDVAETVLLNIKRGDLPRCGGGGGAGGGGGGHGLAAHACIK